MSRTCDKCGFQNLDDSSKYCSRCGSTLAEPIKKPSTNSLPQVNDEGQFPKKNSGCQWIAKGIFYYIVISGVIVVGLIIIVGIWSIVAPNEFSKTTSPTPIPTIMATPVAAMTVDQYSNVEWIWSRDQWGDWQHKASWSGSESGPNSEYGPVIVDDHGEHGTVTNLGGGSTESSVWRTFTDPSGIGWNTLEFTGALTATDMLNGRWMTIDVNDQQIFRGTAAQNPPGNNIKFTIKRSFPQSSSVKVKISNGQTPAWRPLFAMKYYSIKLSRPTSSQQVQPTPSIPFITATLTPAINSVVDGDQAAIDKMTKMEMWINPAMQRVVTSGYSGNYTKMGQNAVLLRDYIDNNLPEMAQLANGATTKKYGAQEYVLFLKDIRTAADLTAQAADKHNSGDINEYTALTLKTNIYLDLAQMHLDKILFSI